jgi:16S rRNA (cytidine1402-2'-O)-methyltransferase
MTFQKNRLAAGLYLVATPIGAARDITLRALDVLASADVLAAEDTRTLRRLMSIHGVPIEGRHIVTYHDHNGPVVRPKILQAIEDGKSVAFASDAGTPGISDPGFALVRDALKSGYPVTSAPGPSAAITALTISGLPTDRFLFAGFAPSASGARRRFLSDLSAIPATLVLYETPKRLDAFLGDCLAVFGASRKVAICRELTKKFEEVRRASLSDISEVISEMPRKGEIVVLIDRAEDVVSEGSLDDALKEALKSSSVKEASRDVAEVLGLSKRDVYQRALALSKSE